MKSGKVGRGGSGGATTATTTGPGTGSMKGTCSICGDRATKVQIARLLFSKLCFEILQFRYSLYSTTSCFSCRAFFRRSLAAGKHASFSCRFTTKFWNKKLPCILTMLKGWWQAVQLPRPTGRNVKLAGVA